MRKIKIEEQFIFFQFALFGQHHYPGHLTLGRPHVHQFDMTVLLQTFKDRGIEFIEFRNRVKVKMFNKYPIAYTHSKDDIISTVLDFGARSCETLCEELAGVVADLLPEDYPAANIQVVVCETEEKAAGMWRGKIHAAEC